MKKFNWKIFSLVMSGILAIIVVIGIRGCRKQPPTPDQALIEVQAMRTELQAAGNTISSLKDELADRDTMYFELLSHQDQQLEAAMKRIDKGIVSQRETQDQLSRLYQKYSVDRMRKQMIATEAAKVKMPPPVKN